MQQLKQRVLIVTPETSQFLEAQRSVRNCYILRHALDAKDVPAILRQDIYSLIIVLAKMHTLDQAVKNICVINQSPIRPRIPIAALAPRSPCWKRLQEAGAQITGYDFKINDVIKTALAS